MQHALKNNLPELKTNVEHLAMLDRPSAILSDLLQCDFMQAMLYLAKHECRGLYRLLIFVYKL